MSLIRKLEAKYNKIEEKLNALASSCYSLYRDDIYDLNIEYADQESFKLPIIPLRIYQNQLRKELFEDGIKRFLIAWPRRAGKEYACFEIMIEASVIDPGLYIMVYPNNVRGRAVLWEGNIILSTGESLPFLKMIPDKLIERIDKTAMKVHLVNGSIIWIVGSDIDPNKLRGINARGVICAEFAFQDPRVFYILLPVLRQNGGWFMGQSTFDGMNHFWRLMQNNKNDPLWSCKIESIVTLVDENGNRYITDEMIDEDRRGGMPEYLIQQEYYCNVQINEQTKYFAIAINAIYESNRIISNYYIPNKNVYAFYDIGVNDLTAICLVQFERKENKLWPIVIGYIENNNQDLQFYVNEIRKFCNLLNLPLSGHGIPHDGKNRNFNDKLKTTLDYLQEMGERGFFVERPSSHRVAIESVRQMLFRTKFNKETTGRLIDCLSNYEKEFDEKMGVFKNTPNHDWSSHGVKSYQTMTLAIEADLINEISYDVVYYNQ